MKREKPKVDETMTGTEAMELLGISRATLSRWVKRGKLTPVNVNPVLDRQKSFYFNRSEVEALLRRA